jgi:hypothetical protein
MRLGVAAFMGAVTAVLSSHAGVAAAQAAGETMSARVYTGIGHTGNAARQRMGRAAHYNELGFRAALSGSRRRMEYSLGGDLGWANYSGSANPATMEGGLAGRMTLGATDDLLQWTFEDSIRQSLLDPAGNLSPGNTEYVNNFSTGPTVNLKLNDRTTLSLAGTYSRMSFEDSPFDTDSVSGSVGISRLTPSGGTFGIHAGLSGSSQTNQNLPTPGYTVRQVYFHYGSAEAGRTSIALDAGYAESLQGGEVSGGALVGLSLTRRLSGISSIYANVSRTITNAAELRPVDPAGLAEYDAPVSAPGAVHSTSVDAGWLASGQRNSLSVAGGWREEDYQAASWFNRRVVYVGASFSRLLRPDLSAALSAQHTREEFSSADAPGVSTHEVGFELSRRFGKRVGAGFLAAYSHRDDKVRSPYEFTEWRFNVTLSVLLTDPRR